MFHKAILENGGILKFVLYWYKNQKMHNKAVDKYSHALELALIAIRLKMCVIKLFILILL